VKAGELRSAVEIALYKHEMDRRLCERERWFSTTLRAIGDGVIATNEVGAVTFMNQAAELMTGMRLEQSIGRSLEEIFQLLDARTGTPIESPIATALREGKVVGLSTPSMLVTPGRECLIDDSAAPIVDDAGRVLGVVLVFRDVSEQRRLQQQVALADRLSSLGTLAAGVAHEINNPLTVVFASADYLAEELGRLETAAVKADGGGVLAEHLPALREMRTATHELQTCAQRVRTIVADLRVFSRPQDEPLGELDLHQAIEWALRVVASQIHTRARLVRNFGPVPRVRASEVRLGQVFVNLLLNAAQAIPEGQPDAQQIQVITRTDRAGRAVIQVRDTGCGIPAELLGRVFEPFFTTKAVGKGSGLGLAVCHGIVQSFGGQIAVESGPGQGSTFSVILPPAEQVPEPRQPPDDQRAHRRGRLLIIDDEPMLLRAMQRALETEHEVVTSSDPRQALALLHEDQTFDLVLCDLLMPGLTGMDVYEQVLGSAPALARRFLFLTGGAFTPRAADFLRSVPHPRLEKPFRFDELQELVRTLLDQQAPP
jgi:PAS domain S-box-containing protein